MQIDGAGAYFEAGTAEGAALLRGILRCVDAALIERHAAVLVERGLAPMLEQGRFDDLGRLYHFLARVDRTELLRLHFGAFVKVRAGAPA